MKGISKLAVAVAAVTYGFSSFGMAAEVAEPGSIKVGGFELTPKLATQYRYDDNVFREGDKATGLAEKSSSVYEIAPSLDFRAKRGLSEYGITLEAKDVNFTSENDASYTDYGVLADATVEFNSRNRLAVDAQFGSYNDEGSARGGSADKKAPEYSLKKGGLVYGLGSTEAKIHADFFANSESKNYKSNSGADRSSKEYGVTGYYAIMPKTDLLLEAKKRNLEYDDNNDSGYDVKSYLVGVNWEATAKTSGFAKIGRRYRDSQVSGVSTEGFTGWEVGVSYLPQSYSLVQLSTSRDYGLESDNPSRQTFTKGTTTRLSWDHDWSSLMKTRAFGSYTSEEIQTSAGITERDRDVKEYGVGVDYAVKRWVTISADYKRSNRDESLKSVAFVSNPNARADDYSRNVYMLSANFAL